SLGRRARTAGGCQDRKRNEGGRCAHQADLLGHLGILLYFCTLTRALNDSHADACDCGPRFRAALRPRGGNAVPPCGWSMSAEAPADVAGGLLLGRMLEYLLGVTELHQAALVQEDGLVRDPAGLRHVVSDDHDGQPRY